MEALDMIKRKRNFDPHNKKITVQDKQLIVDQYVNHNKTASDILKILDGKFKTTKTVYDVLKDAGIEGKLKQDYININHFFFSKIDTPAKAYILGLLITDGWIMSDRGAFGIQLTEEDKNIIEMVKFELKSDITLIKCCKKPFKSDNGKTYKAKDMIRFFAHSQQIVNDLSKYGVIDRKSDKTILPLVPLNLMSHLLRGILDGDGTISYHAQSDNICIRFLGTRVLVAQISMFLAITLGVKFNYPNIRKKRKENYMDLCYVDWESPEEVKKILNYLYKDSDDSHRIKRKYERAQDYIM
jgi:hypothetical protein